MADNEITGLEKNWEGKNIVDLIREFVKPLGYEINNPQVISNMKTKKISISIWIYGKLR